MLTSQVVALATTAAMILLALHLHQKTLPNKSWFRPCISSSSVSEVVHDSSLTDEGTRSRGEKQSSCSSKRRKKNKRVSFVDGVVDPAGYDDEFKRQYAIVKSKTNRNSRSQPSSSSSTITTTTSVDRGMPANRMALYNGILKDRLIQSMAYSY